MLFARSQIFLTDIKRVEDILNEKNEQLIHTSDLLGRKNTRLLEFAQIVSHNLRSPLSNIAALAELCKHGSKEEQKKAVEFIAEVTDKALSTIDDKALSTIDDLNEILKVQQNEKMDLMMIRFEDALTEVKELLKLNLVEKNVSITTNFEAKEIWYSSIYLESIFLNLLSNSIKYMKPKKSPEISIKTYQTGDDIQLEFSDNGIGIDLEKHGDDIFRFGKTFLPDSDGKGIGLYLIKNQIRTMGDDIEVESKPGFGTTFRINFKNQYGRK
jgi:signal transduction histidine kinase